MNALKMMLVGLTLLSAASQGSAQVVKDAGAGTQRVHEIQVTLRKYEFSPGMLRVKKGEQVRLILAAMDHDHGFKLDDFNVNQRVLKGTTVVVEFTLAKLARSNFAARVCAA